MSRVFPTPGVTQPVVTQPDPLLAKAAAAFLERAIWLGPFGLTLTWNTLAASATAQQAKIAVDAGLDLLVTEVNLTSYSAAGTIVANPDYLLELEDGDGKWTDEAQHVGLWTGQLRNSSQPRLLPIARYVRGSNNLVGRLTNLTGTAARVDVGLHGWRIDYRTTTRDALFPNSR